MSKCGCLFYRYHYRSSYQRCSVNKVFLEISQNSQENTFARDSSFNKVAGLYRSFIQKETLARAFSCEFCEISTHTSGQKLLTTFGKRLSLLNYLLFVSLVRGPFLMGQLILRSLFLTVSVSSIPMVRNPFFVNSGIL